MRSSLLELYEAVRFLEFDEARCYGISKDNMYDEDDDDVVADDEMVWIVMMVWRWWCCRR